MQWDKRTRSAQKSWRKLNWQRFVWVGEQQIGEAKEKEVFSQASRLMIKLRLPQEIITLKDDRSRSSSTLTPPFPISRYLYLPPISFSQNLFLSKTPIT